jgi:hypothetical protein
MNQGADGPSWIHANPPPKAATGFTADAPAPAVGVRPRVLWVRLALLLLAVVAAVSLVVAGATGLLQHVLFGFPATPMTEEKANQMALAGPPPSSTLAEVEAWLNAQGITSNPPGQGASYDIIRLSADARWEMDQVGHQTVAECAGLKTGDVHSYVRVWYPDADRYYMGKDRITIYFFFDGNDRLLKHWVDVFHVMP